MIIWMVVVMFENFANRLGLQFFLVKSDMYCIDICTCMALAGFLWVIFHIIFIGALLTCNLSTAKL